MILVSIGWVTLLMIGSTQYCL